MNNQYQNGMMNGNAYPNNGFAPYGGNFGMGYAAPTPQALNTQPLTMDIVNTLRQDGNEFNMKVEQKELWRAVCTHKDPSNGQSTLIDNRDGTFTCTICGETFNFFEGDESDIETAVKVLTDMMQTCKTVYLDAPNAMTEQYYQMIPLLRRFPLLWKHAMKNFAKYENYNNPLVPVNGNYSGFNAINQLLTNPYGYQPYYGQPMMAPQYGYMPQQNMMAPQQPMMMNQQNMMAPQMMPQQNMMYQNGMTMDQNPLGYGVPAAPQTAPAAGVMPTAPAAPAPAAQNGEIQQQKVYNV